MRKTSMAAFCGLAAISGGIAIDDNTPATFDNLRTYTSKAARAPDSLAKSDSGVWQAIIRDQAAAIYDFGETIRGITLEHKRHRLYVSSQDGYVYLFNLNNGQTEQRRFVRVTQGYSRDILLIDEDNEQLIMYNEGEIRSSRAIFVLNANSLQVIRKIDVDPAIGIGIKGARLFRNEVFYYGSGAFFASLPGGSAASIPHDHPWSCITYFITTVPTDTIYGLCNESVLQIAANGHVGNVINHIEINSVEIAGGLNRLERWSGGFAVSEKLYMIAHKSLCGSAMYLFDINKNGFDSSRIYLAVGIR